MGRETTLQAFPSNWQPWASENSNDAIGDDIQSVFCFLAWLRRKQHNTDAKEYFSNESEPQRRGLYIETLELLTTDSTLLWRYADLDRRFEVLLYLLVETTSSTEQRELFQVAINGQEQVRPHATAGQGFPINWNDAETTARINDALMHVAFGDLAKHYSTEKYLQQALYKKSTDKRELTYLHAYFCQLKEYYRAAASAQNVTIFLVD